VYISNLFHVVDEVRVRRQVTPREVVGSTGGVNDGLVGAEQSVVGPQQLLNYVGFRRFRVGTTIKKIK
jgi:hypothetical protein